MHSLQSREKNFVDLHNCSNMHNSWETVIWWLTSVDIIVWMNKFASELSAHNLNGSVRNDFISVHIWLGSRSCLPDNQWEVIVKLSLNDLISSLNDGTSDFRIKSIALVDFSGTFLQNTESSNDWSWHSIGVSADIEILFWSLGLSSPESVRRDLDGSKSILFFSELRKGVRNEAVFFYIVIEDLGDHMNKNILVKIWYEPWF